MATVKGNPNCKNCGLHETAQSVCLMGRGAKPAKIMLVGEAPGHREDDAGKPFQGNAGKLLDKLLKKSGWSRDSVYITNTVRCRPPDNRKPSNKEIKACREYTEKELKAVNPKYVVLMGAMALKGVLGQAGITEKHGSIIRQDGRTYLPTFHPAAALHDPKRYAPLEEDFKKFGELVRGKVREKPKLNIVLIEDAFTLKQCLKDIRRSSHVSFDTETTGLDQREEGAAVNTLQIGTKTTQWILPLNIAWSVWKDDYDAQRDMIHAIADALKDVPWVSGQNAKFDNLWLWIHYDVRFKLTIDTKIAAHMLDENTPNGLKYLARAYLGAHDYDISLEDKKGQTANKEEFCEYGAYDVYYTRKLAIKFLQMIKATDGLFQLFTELMMQGAGVMEKADYTGFYVNEERRKEVRKILQKNIAAVEKKLNKHAKINWNSPAQVGKLLFGKFGLTPLEWTPTGTPSTNESVMDRLADQHPVPKLLVELRGYKKQLSTYVDGWEPLIHNGYVYFSSNITGTVTGRLSSRLHQVPRDPFIRSLIDAPPGWVFWSADFSQIELRITAMVAGEVTMMAAFRDGIDIHLVTACEMLGKPPEDITKEERKMAKAVNFGFIYGMSANKFVIYARDNYGVTVTPKEGKQFRKRFFAKYPGLLPWHGRQRDLVRALAQVRSPIGRIRRLLEVNSPEQGLRAEAERQAINSPVQGFASDLKLMSMVEIDKKLNWKECKISGEVHDSILGMVRIEHVNKYMHIIKSTMESPEMLKRFGVKIPVPIVADVDIGAWGNGKAWKVDRETYKKMDREKRSAYYRDGDDYFIDAVKLKEAA